MSFPKKHIYQEGSPGAAREKAKTTLTQNQARDRTRTSEASRISEARFACE
jgi:hypothetical protein